MYIYIYIYIYIYTYLHYEITISKRGLAGWVDDWLLPSFPGGMSPYIHTHIYIYIYIYIHTVGEIYFATPNP